MVEVDRARRVAIAVSMGFGIGEAPDADLVGCPLRDVDPEVVVVAADVGACCRLVRRLRLGEGEGAGA
jgi:hypothetical protein